MSALIPALLVLGGGHRGVHAARNLFFPGAGLVDEQLWLGLLFIALGIATTVAWLKWGTDWILLSVLALAMALSAALTTTDHEPVPVATVAHEFPIVMLAVAALSWLRATTARLPVVRRWLARRPRQTSVGDRCRAATVFAIGGDQATATATLPIDAALRRARRISRAARFRRGDPLVRDHAALRAALVAIGKRSDTPGIPCSEPTWRRPLDVTLYGVATDTDLTDFFRHEFALRRSHRPAWFWTPLDIAAGRLTEWEHATATALARTRGWVGDEDWAAIRQQTLGAAARGTQHPHDERTIAAARIWLAFVVDDAAARIVDRPTISHDPIAIALDRLANQLRSKGTP